MNRKVLKNRATPYPSAPGSRTLAWACPPPPPHLWKTLLSHLSNLLTIIWTLVQPGKPPCCISWICCCVPWPSIQPLLKSRRSGWNEHNNNILYDVYACRQSFWFLLGGNLPEILRCISSQLYLRTWLPRPGLWVPMAEGGKPMRCFDCFHSVWCRQAETNVHEWPLDSSTGARWGQGGDPTRCPRPEFGWDLATEPSEFQSHPMVSSRCEVKKAQQASSWITFRRLLQICMLGPRAHKFLKLLYCAFLKVV